MTLTIKNYLVGILWWLIQVGWVHFVIIIIIGQIDQFWIFHIGLFLIILFVKFIDKTTLWSKLIKLENYKGVFYFNHGLTDKRNRRKKMVLELEVFCLLIIGGFSILYGSRIDLSNIIKSVIIVPILEELFFRGFLYNKLATGLTPGCYTENDKGFKGLYKWPMLISSIMFAVLIPIATVPV